MPKLSNPRNYSMNDLINAYEAERLGVNRKRLELEEELRRIEISLSFRTDDEILKAINSDVSKREVARKLGMSPNTLYARLERIQKEKGVAGMVPQVETPYSSWFAKTDDPLRFTCQVQTETQGFRSTLYPGTAFSFGVLYKKDGTPMLRDVKDCNPTKQKGPAEFALMEDELPRMFVTWAAAAVPELDLEGLS